MVYAFPAVTLTVELPVKVHTLPLWVWVKPVGS